MAQSNFLKVKDFITESWLELEDEDGVGNWYFSLFGRPSTGYSLRYLGEHHNGANDCTDVSLDGCMLAMSPSPGEGYFSITFPTGDVLTLRTHTAEDYHNWYRELSSRLVTTHPTPKEVPTDTSSHHSGHAGGNEHFPVSYSDSSNNSTPHFSSASPSTASVVSPQYEEAGAGANGVSQLPPPAAAAAAAAISGVPNQMNSMYGHEEKREHVAHFGGAGDANYHQQHQQHQRYHHPQHIDPFDDDPQTCFNQHQAHVQTYQNISHIPASASPAAPSDMHMNKQRQPGATPNDPYGQFLPPTAHSNVASTSSSSPMLISQPAHASPHSQNASGHLSHSAPGQTPNFGHPPQNHQQNAVFQGEQQQPYQPHTHAAPHQDYHQHQDEASQYSQSYQSYDDQHNISAQDYNQQQTPVAYRSQPPPSNPYHQQQQQPDFDYTPQQQQQQQQQQERQFHQPQEDITPSASQQERQNVPQPGECAQAPQSTPERQQQPPHEQQQPQAMSRQQQLIHRQQQRLVVANQRTPTPMPASRVPTTPRDRPPLSPEEAHERPSRDGSAAAGEWTAEVSAPPFDDRPEPHLSRSSSDLPSIPEAKDGSESHEKSSSPPSESGESSKSEKSSNDKMFDTDAKRFLYEAVRFNAARERGRKPKPMTPSTASASSSGSSASSNPPPASSSFGGGGLTTFEQALSSSFSMPPPPKKKEKVYDAEMRAKRVAEIISTEEQYLQGLNHLEAEYAQPLESLVPPLMHANLFTMFRMIRGVHLKFIDDLKAKRGDHIAQLFKTDTFRCYVNYAKAYDNIIKGFKELEGKPANFVAKREKKDKNAISTYFIMPIQRLPRYELLLKALLKETPQDHPEYKEVQEAISKIAETNSYINEKLLPQKKSIANGIDPVAFELASKISGENVPSIAITGRKHIRKSPARQLKRAKFLESFRDVKMFLFDDLFVWTDTKHKYLGHCMLASSKVFKEPEVVGASGFKVTDSGEHHPRIMTVVMRCENAAEATAWIQDLQVAIFRMSQPLQVNARMVHANGHPGAKRLLRLQSVDKPSTPYMSLLHQRPTHRRLSDQVVSPMAAGSQKNLLEELMRTQRTPKAASSPSVSRSSISSAPTPTPAPADAPKTPNGASAAPLKRTQHSTFPTHMLATNSSTSSSSKSASRTNPSKPTKNGSTLDLAGFLSASPVSTKTSGSLSKPGMPRVRTTPTNPLHRPSAAANSTPPTMDSLSSSNLTVPRAGSTPSPRLSASSLAAPVGKRRFFPKPLSNRGNKTKSNKHSPRAAVANSAVANSAVARTRHSRSDAERTLDTARSVSAPPNVDPAMQAQNSHRSNGDTADQYQFVPSRIAQMSQTVSIKRINVSALAGLPIRGAGGSPPPSKDTDNSDSSVPPLPLTRPLSMTPPPSTPSTPSTPGGAGPSPTPSSPDWERASAQEIASLSTARSKRVSPLSAPHGNSRSRSTGNPFSGLMSASRGPQAAARPRPTPARDPVASWSPSGGGTENGADALRGRSTHHLSVGGGGTHHKRASVGDASAFVRSTASQNSVQTSSERVRQIMRARTAGGAASKSRNGQARRHHHMPTPMRRSAHQQHLLPPNVAAYAADTSSTNGSNNGVNSNDTPAAAARRMRTASTGTANAQRTRGAVKTRGRLVGGGGGANSRWHHNHNGSRGGTAHHQQQRSLSLSATNSQAALAAAAAAGMANAVASRSASGGANSYYSASASHTPPSRYASAASAAAHHDDVSYGEHENAYGQRHQQVDLQSSLRNGYRNSSRVSPARGGASHFPSPSSHAASMSPREFLEGLSSDRPR